MRTLVVQEAKLKLMQVDQYDFEYEGGDLVIRYQTNTPVSISIPDSASTWCKVVRTKASMADSSISVHVERNEDIWTRRTSVSISNLFGVGYGSTIAFKITQAPDSTAIQFEDVNLKNKLLSNEAVNRDKDQKISRSEARAVTNLETLFGDELKKGASYTHFNEFRYFTGITSIPGGSFNHWTQLEEITIPESITEIQNLNDNEPGIFVDCPKLISILGAFNVNGRALVFDKNNNKYLIAVAAGASSHYIIPDGVTTICSQAVYGLDTLCVPTSVTRINTNAFAQPKLNPDFDLVVYFKGETPPDCGDVLGGPGSNINNGKVKVSVPAVVKDDGSVDNNETNNRKNEFIRKFGSDAQFILFDDYTEWPFEEEGIPISATIASKQAYVSESASASILGNWLVNENIAVLYEVGGVHKRANARITEVKSNGEATILFTVDKKVPDNTDIACTLVFPLSAAKNDNTGPKSYSDMADSQDGTLDKCLDVRVGAGTIHTGNAPTLSISTPFQPLYGIVLLSLREKGGPGPFYAQTLVVKANGNTLVTSSSSVPRNEFYLALPPMSNESISLEATGGTEQCTYILNNQTIKAGQYYIRRDLIPQSQ